MQDRKDLDAFIAAHREEAEQTLMELARLPAPTRHEEQRAAYVMHWLRHHGSNEVWKDSAGNVISSFACSRYNDITVFAAHMDVVFDDRMPLPLSRRGRKVFCPGCGDDTANLVNLLYLSQYISENSDRLKTGILIVADTCEEGLGNSDGIRTLFSNYGDRIRRFYSFDAYMGMIMNGAVGSHRYRIAIQTEGGHSYQNFGNANAIAQAAELIQMIYSQPLPSAMKTTYNVGRIEGGTTVNSIAEHVEFLYEYRSESEECLKQMKQNLKEIIHTFRQKNRTVHVEVIGIRPGEGKIDQEDFQKWTEENEKTVSLYYPGPYHLAANSSDANIPLSMGIYANTIGTIRGGNPHTREEWIDLDSLSTGMGMALSLAELYMK